MAPSTAPQALSHVPLTEHLPPPPLRPLLAAVRASPKSLPCECAARRTRPPVQRELRRGPAVLKVVHACALAAMPAALAAWGDRTKTAMARGPRCVQILQYRSMFPIDCVLPAWVMGRSLFTLAVHVRMGTATAVQYLCCLCAVPPAPSSSPPAPPSPSPPLAPPSATGPTHTTCPRPAAASLQC